MFHALDYFVKLGFHEDCSDEKIKKQFRKFSLSLHPDKYCAESYEAECNVKVFICYTVPTDKQLSEVRNNNWILFELDQEHKTWILHTCVAEPDITKEQPLCHYRVLIRAHEADFLNTCVKPAMREACKELGDEFHRQALELASKNGRKSLFEAHSERCALLNALHNRFKDAAIRSMYKTAYDEVCKFNKKMSSQAMSMKLVEQQVNVKNMVQKICRLVTKILDENIIVWYQKEQATAININNFIVAWMRLMDEFCHYLTVIRKDIFEHISMGQTHYLIDKVLKLIFETYWEYVENKVEVVEFDKGNFILSLLLNAISKDILLFVKFMRYKIKTFEFEKITSLNDLQIYGIKHVMCSTDQMLCINTSLLCLTLVELALNDKHVFLDILDQGISNRTREYLKIVLSNDVSTKINILSSGNNPKSKALRKHNKKKENFEKQRKKDEDVHDNLVRKWLCSQEKYDDNALQAILFNDAAVKQAIESNIKNADNLDVYLQRYPGNGKNLIFEYFYSEQSKILSLLSGCLSIIVEEPTVVNANNVGALKKHLALINDKTIIQAKFFMLALFKKYIYPAYLAYKHQLNKDKIPYCENLLWRMLEVSSKNVKKQLGVPYTSVNTKLQSQRMFIADYSAYMARIAQLDLRLMNNNPELFNKGGTINPLPFSIVEARAFEMLRQMNELFALMLPIEIEENNTRVRLTVIEVVNNYLDSLCRDKFDRCDLKSEILDITDDNKKFKNIGERVYEILKDYRSLYRVITNPKPKNRNMELIAGWKNKLETNLREYANLRNEIYHSSSLRIVAIICTINKAHCDKLRLLCKNASLYLKKLTKSKVYRLFNDENYAADIKQKLPADVIKSVANEKVVYNSITLEVITYLESCCVALEKLFYCENEIKNINVFKQLKIVEENYHKIQYSKYCDEFKNWVEYASNTYRYLEDVCEDIDTYEINIIKNLTQFEKRRLNKDYKLGIDALKKELYQNNNEKDKESISYIENDIHKLRDLINENIFKLNHLRLEMVSSTKKLIDLPTNNATLQKCLDVWHMKLKGLAQNADTDRLEVNLINFPMDSDLEKLQALLDGAYIRIIEHCDNVGNLRKKLQRQQQEFVRLLSLHEKEKELKFQSLRNQFEVENQEIATLYNELVRLFDDFFCSKEKISDPQSIKHQKIKRMKIEKISNYIEALKEKFRKMDFLRNNFNKFQKIIKETVVKNEPNFAGNYKNFNEYVEHLDICLNDHSSYLFSECQELLLKISQLSTDKKNVHISISKEIDNIIATSNELTSKYDDLIELITAIENIDFSFSINKNKISEISESIDILKESIASIQNSFVDERNINKKGMNLRGIICMPMTEFVKEENKKNDDAILKKYKIEFEILSKQMQAVSHKIFDLNLEITRSEHTIKAYLPKVLPSHGREGLRLKLEEKIVYLADQIRSHAEVIYQLRCKGAKFVCDAIGKLAQSFQVEDKCEIDQIKCIIESDHCSDISLYGKGWHYILSIDTKSGERYFYPLQTTAHTRKELNLLSIAIKGHTRLLGSNWYANQANFIISKITEFLHSIAVNKNKICAKIYGNSLYTELLSYIINVTQRAQKNIDIFVGSSFALLSLDERNQQYNELERALIDLDTGLGLIITLFNKEFSMHYDLIKYNVFAIRAILITIIHEQVRMFYSMLAIHSAPHYMYEQQTFSIPSSNAMAIVPYTANPCCFFERVNNPTSHYVAIPSSGFVCTGQLF